MKKKLRVPLATRGIVGLGALVALLLLPGCPKDEPVVTVKPPPFKPQASSAKPVLDEPLRLKFTDVTKAAGIDFVHETGADGRKLLPETMGSGCAWLDHDGDGDQDLLLLSGGPWRASRDPRPTVRLFRNDGAWRFTDATNDAGLSAVSPYALGVSCADTDGDGDQDVLVTGVGGYWFLRNDGGKFTALAKADTGLDPGTWKDRTGAEHGPFATSSAWLDYDRDGRPDVFVCHYVHWSEETDIPSLAPDGRSKTYAIPTLYDGESCRLWRNLGGNRFEDATDKAKVRNDRGKSLGVCVLDVDDDGDPDIAVANDTQQNYLYVNGGDGTFRDLGVDWNLAWDKAGRARAGMGIDAAWIGAAEQKLHVAIGNFSGEPVGIHELRGKTRPQFTECGETRIAEPTMPYLTFGVRWADVDLDGRTDLVVANGHIEPTIQDIHADISYREPLQMLRQRPDGSFVDLGALAGDDSIGDDVAVPRVHRACASADVDLDGDLDWVFTVNGGPPVLLRCDLEDAAKRSLRVQVVGAAPGTDALGAKVTVEVPGLPTQTRCVTSGAGYLSECERTLTFGVGGAGTASKVTVRWPGGRERTWTIVPAGTLRAE